jgi:hypothetical protein
MSDIIIQINEVPPILIDSIELAPILIEVSGDNVTRQEFSGLLEKSQSFAVAMSIAL